MSINNMKNRINYHGGPTQIERMNEDKLRSLKKALLYSYQTATAILSGGREFRCLINPNKLSLDLDNKIISIPFKDVCLNSGVLSGDLDSNHNQTDEDDWENMIDLTAVLTQIDQWEDMSTNTETVPGPLPETTIPNEIMETNIKEGDVITWKENGSHWIVYLRRLEETAYFRADIRRCRYQLTLGNGSKYWVYVRGPVEQSILWTQSSGNYFNKLNYSLVMYITQNEETLKYFHRFKKVMINGQPWEVQAVDNISTPGILEVALKETYNNTIENNIEKAVEEAQKKEIIEEKSGIYIYGTEKVYPYEVHTYELKNYNGSGRWVISNESRKNLVKIKNSNMNSVELFIITGKSGSFTLFYIEEDFVVAELNIDIGSL